MRAGPDQPLVELVAVPQVLAVPAHQTLRVAVVGAAQASAADVGIVIRSEWPETSWFTQRTSGGSVAGLPYEEPSCTYAEPRGTMRQVAVQIRPKNSKCASKT